MGGREAPWFAACMGCVLSLADGPQLPLALSDSALCWRIRQIAAVYSIMISGVCLLPSVLTPFEEHASWGVPPHDQLASYE